MLITNWIILAALAGIFSNVFNFFSRLFLKDDGDATSWAWTFETIRLVIFVFLAIFDFKLQFNLNNFLILLAVGLSEFISVYLYMKMHQYYHLSISTIISRTRLVWIPVIALIFLGERLTNLEYLGIFLLFAGLSIVVAPNKLFVDKGAIYANLAAFVIAINTIFQKQATPFASISLIMVAMSLPSVILFPIFMKNAKKRLINTQQLFLKILAVLANVFSSILFLMALKLGDVSKANAVYQSMMILGVIAGIIFLNERKDIFKKLLGSIVTIIGVILLT